MFDEPLSKGSRLPESPRISSMLAGLMGHSTASSPSIQPPVETPEAARSTPARTFSTFLKSIQWSYIASSSSLVVVTPGMPVREFFGLVNWSGDKNRTTSSAGGASAPPSVENLMSQFSWD